MLENFIQKYHNWLCRKKGHNSMTRWYLNKDKQLSAIIYCFRCNRSWDNASPQEGFENSQTKKLMTKVKGEKA